jgi:hypothetical protein
MGHICLSVSSVAHATMPISIVAPEFFQKNRSLHLHDHDKNLLFHGGTPPKSPLGVKEKEPQHMWYQAGLQF